MPVKQQGRKTYKTMQGKSIDMDLLRQRNELTPAVGNARVNARGDELGPGGKIIKKREDILQDHYADHPQAVPDEVIERQVEEQPAPVTETKAQKKVRSSKSDTEWVEDEDGNFVPKGE